MNCRRFTEILADFQEGKLSPDERSAAQMHLEICAACRRLKDIAFGKVDVLPDNRRDALAKSILHRTSGSACSRVESLLWDFVDGGLGADDSQLMALHLDCCNECKSIAGELALIQEVLPTIAEIDPGESFTREVVRSTGRWHPSRSNRAAPFQSWWNRMILHPLFSFQTAYVGAVVLFFAFSRPLLPHWQAAFDTISSEAIQPAMTYSVSIWGDTTAPFSKQADELASAISAKRQATAEYLSRIGKNYEYMSASMVGRSMLSIRAWRQRQQVALFTFWIRLTNSVSRSG